MHKEYSASAMLLSVVVSFSAGMSCNSNIIIADSDDVIIIDDTISDESDEDVTLSGGVLDKQTLDCYPQINEATLGKRPHSGRYGISNFPVKGTEFTCGGIKFLVSSYSESESDHSLGGYFPVTKTLSQIGCKLEGETLICREEGSFKALHGAVLLSYREIVAEVISTPGN